MTTTLRENLLQAATRLMLERGYNGTTVDEICSAAGATKGAFFHHFKNKDDIGFATLDRYAERIFAVMKEGADRRPEEPVGRVYDYVDALAEIGNKVPGRKPACLLAIETMELGAVHESFRLRCEQHFEHWAHYLEELIDGAVASLPHEVDVTPRHLAEHFIGVFEGSLVLARARGESAVIERNLAQYRRYLEMVFRGRPELH